MDLIEIYTHNSEGYNPFFIQNGWQVAQLNYSKEQHIDNITKVDIHHRTDEIFILTKGKAVLISARIENNDIQFETILMNHGVVYNIPRKVWHNIAMQKDTEVIIVEKDNTHLRDFDFFYLSSIQKDKLVASVNSILKI